MHIVGWVLAAVLTGYGLSVGVPFITKNVPALPVGSNPWIQKGVAYGILGGAAILVFWLVRKVAHTAKIPGARHIP